MATRDAGRLRRDTKSPRHPLGPYGRHLLVLVPVRSLGTGLEHQTERDDGQPCKQHPGTRETHDEERNHVRLYAGRCPAFRCEKGKLWRTVALPADVMGWHPT